MFIQVIQGQVEDRAALNEALDRWAAELAPGASGWVGTTAGVTDDGEFVILARFHSAAEARRNSERPEQAEWWAGVEKLLSGPATFADSNQVSIDLVGDPDQAGFVQVMQGQTSDPEQARELMSGDSADWSAFRPDVLGSVSIEHADNRWTMAIYFTSEAEAREGERKEPPADIAEQMSELDKLSIGETRYFDLREPWLYAPR